MEAEKKDNFNYNLLNFLYFIFPITFISGIGTLNTAVVLICIIGSITFRNKLHLAGSKIVVISISLFFILTICFTIFENTNDLKNEQVIRSINYLRFLLFFFITSIFIKIGQFNFRLFLISSSLLALVLSIDIIFQFFFGYNILGFKAYEYSRYHLSGFLKDELIAGGIIQKLSLFTILLFPLIFTKSNNNKSLIIIILIITFFMGIFFSGNRMPLVMFMFSLFIIFLVFKEFRFQVALSVLLCTAIFFTIFNTHENFKIYYKSFYSNSSKMIENIKKYSVIEYPELENETKPFLESKIFKDGKADQNIVKKYDVYTFGSGHLIIYLTAIDLWTDKPFIGSGIKSFRKKCASKLHLPNRVCESHAHNIYLDLLNDLGLLGVLPLFISILFIFKNQISNFRKLKNTEKLLIITFLIVLFIEIFPLRSSGSFFSTPNSSFLFFLLAVLNGFKRTERL